MGMVIQSQGSDVIQWSDMAAGVPILRGHSFSPLHTALPYWKANEGRQRQCQASLSPQPHCGSIVVVQAAFCWRVLVGWLRGRRHRAHFLFAFSKTFLSAKSYICDLHSEHLVMNPVTHFFDWKTSYFPLFWSLLVECWQNFKLV